MRRDSLEPFTINKVSSRLGFPIAFSFCGRYARSVRVIASSLLQGDGVRWMTCKAGPMYGSGSQRRTTRNFIRSPRNPSSRHTIADTLIHENHRRIMCVCRNVVSRSSALPCHSKAILFDLTFPSCNPLALHDHPAHPPIRRHQGAATCVRVIRMMGYESFSLSAPGAC